MPRISDTEAAALNSGTVGFDRDLFSGTPSLNALVDKYDNKFTDEEQAYFDNECNVLCEMIDNYQIGLDQNLPPEVWAYVRDNGFLGLCISPSYGGKGFSAHAHSVMLQKVATRSIAAAVTVMVPNSLGPAELLKEYGTEAQKDHYLPRLAKGVDIPCFALTGPPSGSDAAAMRDSGIVCTNEEGVLGIRATFNKRYITLAPVATVIGLAINVSDPDGLLSDPAAKDGITVVLLDNGHPGLETGPRHNPLDAAFMNGSVRGTDVFIPIDQVVGGAPRVGFGWNMLMECLGEGRGISLPASAGGICQSSVHAVGGYARIRKQFKVPIATMEGVQEKLANIASKTYACTAAQHMFNAIVGQHERPPVLSAIMKHECTEIGRIVCSDAMDILGGAGICKGPMNFMAAAYQSTPVAITVEGANVLTRSLIIFGQGLNRAHPHMQDLIKSIQHGDDLKGFNRHLAKLVGHGVRNAGSAFTQSITRSRRGHGVAYHESQLNRLAAAFAVTADMGLVLGGKLKVAECLSGRYADVLSKLYLGYSMLWFDRKHPNVQGSDVVLEHALTQNLADIEDAFFGIFRNFPIRPVGMAMKAVAFPLGRCYLPPDDRSVRAAADAITTKTGVRSLLSASMFISQDPLDRVRQINDAFPRCIEADDILRTLRREKRDPTAEEQRVVDEAEEMRERIIQVDTFEQLTHPHQELVRNTAPHVEPADQRRGLQRQSSFASHLADVDPSPCVLKQGGTEGHNDPHNEKQESALGW